MSGHVGVAELAKLSLLLGIMLVSASSPAQTVWHVDDDATGGQNNGTSWDDAFTDLQDALVAAGAADEIRVAGGRYVPSELTDPNDPRSATFQLISGVGLYGGYAGLSDPNDPEARDFELYETILSGDIGLPDDPNDNAYHVVTGSGTDAAAILDGFTITGGNEPFGWPGGGAGMRNEGGSPTVRRCEFRENWAYYGGAGIFNTDSSATIIDCVFRNNSAYVGAGVCNYYANNPVVVNCAFVGNSVGPGGEGGAAYNLQTGTSTIINSTFSGNSSVGGGGALTSEYTGPTALINCTFAQNTCENGTGGAIRVYAASLSLENCILWGNSAPPDQGPQLSLSGAAATASLSYTDIEGGLAEIYVCGDCGVDWQNGNINADPLFVHADDGDVHLRRGSPCIDAADNGSVPDDEYDIDGDDDTTEPIPLDLDGNPRFVDDACADDTGDGTPPIVDMGAYELQAPDLPVRLYVDDDAPPGGDGSSWVNAFKHLQDALTLAEACSPFVQEIWVAQGTYRPDEDADDPNGTGDRDATFQLISGVAIYGGYVGLADPNNPDARDIEAFKTVLSGDLDDDDTPGLDNYDDNSKHVVTGSGVDETAVLDGFTITGGWNWRGAGMYNVSGSPTVRNCVLQRNKGALCDGPCGVGMYNETSSPTVVDCVFRDNLATTQSRSVADGAAMANNVWSNPTVINCVFERNRAIGGHGGAVSNSEYSVARFVNCVFIGNSADQGGGAIFNSWWITQLELVNCIICGNEGGASGGIWGGDSNYVGDLVNCTICGNSGYGVYTVDGNLVNCTLWGNGDGQIHGSPPVSYSLVEGGYSGDGNIDDDPRFVGGGSGTWTDEAEYDDQTDQTTFHHMGAGWTDDELVGKSLQPNADPNSPTSYLQALITGNTANTITVWGDLSDPNAAGVPYQVHDYHLLAGSPCIDAANNMAVPEDDYDIDDDQDTDELLPLDVDGNPRFVDDLCTADTGLTDQQHPELPVVDMGAYEFQAPPPPERLYVDDDAAPGGDGTSWETAYNDLQDALARAEACGPAVDEITISVAQGTYVPSELTDPNDPRTATFRLITGVSIYGGYAGLSDPNDPNSRDIGLYESILSGDLEDNDGPGFTGYDENSYHVVNGSGTDDSAVLDGFTITGGNGRGGGMYNQGGSPTVRNCLFLANHTDGAVGGAGAGMYNDESNPKVVNCTFRNNNALLNDGGALCNWCSGPVLIGCVFESNVGREGGAVAFYVSTGPMPAPELINCAFLGNGHVDGKAGAIWVQGNNNLHVDIVNCAFIGNYSSTGAAVNVGGGTADIVGSTFCGNTPTGVVSSGGSIINCIAWGNTEGQISAPSVSYSCVQSWTGGGEGNTDADPRFVDADAGDYRLLPDSPAAGAGGPETLSPTDLRPAVIHDFYGNPRPDPPACGAFEVAAVGGDQP